MRVYTLSIRSTHGFVAHPFTFLTTVDPFSVVIATLQCHLPRTRTTLAHIGCNSAAIDYVSYVSQCIPSPLGCSIALNGRVDELDTATVKGIMRYENDIKVSLSVENFTVLTQIETLENLKRVVINTLRMRRPHKLSLNCLLMSHWK